MTTKRNPPKRSNPKPKPKRRNPWIFILLGAVIALGAVVTVVRATSSSPTTPAATIQPLAGVDTAATGTTVDGIQCQSSEQVLFHVHSHLAVYVNGVQRSIPEGIGVAPPRQTQQQADGTPFVVSGSCFYWLHSHTADGIIHVESPVQRTYTLGNWFDIWGQPLSATQVGPARGTVIAYVDGQRFTGNPRDIPLGDHTLIQLDVGSDVAPQGFTFPPGL
ncbi:MAG TPA: hypothetical protein VGQ42_15405 [Candidatus Dormibacteraeota bacterium]|jgi:hypothetical protein|nr:hypothetical protein [Candidatus Dormibacteraeota bacterium]